VHTALTSHGYVTSPRSLAENVVTRHFERPPAVSPIVVAAPDSVHRRSARIANAFRTDLSWVYGIGYRPERRDSVEMREQQHFGSRGRRELDDQRVGQQGRLYGEKYSGSTCSRSTIRT
jgi:hypothetical protein